MVNIYVAHYCPDTNVILGIDQSTRVCISVKGWQCIIYHLSRSACKIRDMGSDRLKAPVERLLKLNEIPLCSCTHLWRVLSLHITILNCAWSLPPVTTKEQTHTKRKHMASCNFSSVFQDIREFRCYGNATKMLLSLPFLEKCASYFLFLPTEQPVIFWNNYTNTL